jgi:hypothetical protein
MANFCYVQCSILYVKKNKAIIDYSIKDYLLLDYK